MLSVRSRFPFILIVGGLLWLPAGSQAQDVQDQQPRATTAPGSLPGAPAEGTSEEIVVTYQNGKLTIKARNARLSDILRRICDKTGAVLDALSVDEEGVFVDLGPGPVRDVLGALLNNSTFNYAMVGSTGNPNGLARVLVFPRSKNGNAEKEVDQQPLASTLTASYGEKPRQQLQRTKPSQIVGTVGDSQQEAENARDTDSVATLKDANTANMPGQIEALIKAAAAGEAVDETALFQAAAQLASDTSSSSLSFPSVDPSDPLPPSRSRHRRR